MKLRLRAKVVSQLMSIVEYYYEGVYIGFTWVDYKTFRVSCGLKANIDKLLNDKTSSKDSI